MDLSAYFLKEIIPAFGCTEPIALAFTSARAREVLGLFPEELWIRCSGNMIKNAKSVVIPNSGGKKGIEYSALLGMLVGKSEKNLEILESVTDEQIKQAVHLYEAGVCHVDFVPRVPNLYIEAEVRGQGHSAVVAVKNSHTHVVKIEKDGETIFSVPETEEEKNTFTADFEEIESFARQGNIDLLRPVIEKEIEYNMAIAREGISHKWGANIGKMILEGGSDFGRIKQAYAAAGSDARMSGCSLPVMINSGSGNQGITLSVPLILEADHMGTDHENLVRSLVFANLIGLYLKSGIGKLSAYCGAMSAASAGAAGIAFLHGENGDVIRGTLTNTLASLSGVVCDGAKPSCAIKIGMAVGTGEIAYRQAKSGNTFHAGDGIVKKDVDDTIHTVSVIAHDGMKETDNIILEEMLRK